jgi:hypothetical protein
MDELNQIAKDINEIKIQPTKFAKQQLTFPLDYVSTQILLQTINFKKQLSDFFASGTGTLVSGTATINNNSIKSTSFIFVTPTSSDGAHDYSIYVSASNGSFTANSHNASDSRTFNYFVII